MEDATALPGSCVICAKSTSLQCQGCKKAQGQDAPFYCGNEHQIAHWKGGHKKNCGVIVKSDNGSGWEEICGDKIDKHINHGLPYYVATQDLEAGHTIFVKKPLLIIPSILSRQDEAQMLSFQSQAEAGNFYNWGPNERKIWTCFSCHEMMIYGLNIKENKKTTYKCKCLKCGWPVHTNPILGQRPTKCELMHEAECKVLVSSGQTWDRIDPSYKMLNQDGNIAINALYHNLSLLRAFLLPPELKEKLLRLPVLLPDSIFERSPFYSRYIAFARACNLGELSEVKKMMRIVLSNKTSPPRFYETRNKRVFSLILQDGPTGRILSHGCKPNCEMYVDPDTFKATFKTVRPVSNGDTLTINYVVNGYLMPVHERMIELTQLFVIAPTCMCPRCIDPTEDGTFFSAIKCLPKKNKKDKRRQQEQEPLCEETECQYLFPLYKIKNSGILDIHDSYEWNVFCKHCCEKNSYLKKSQAQVTTFCWEIRLQIDAATSAKNYEGLKRLIANNSGVTVHPGHHLMFSAAINLGLTVINIMKEFHMYNVPGSDHYKFRLHHRFLEDVENAYKFYERVQPGRWQTTGLLLFYRTMLRISELAEHIEKSVTREVQDWDESLEEINKDLKESWIILTNSTTLLPYHLNEEIQSRKTFSGRLNQVFKEKNLVGAVKSFREFFERNISLPDMGTPPSVYVVKEENLLFESGFYNFIGIN